MKKQNFKQNKKRIFRFDEVDDSLEWDLKHSGYYFATNRDIYGKEESYYFKPFFHETARHGILVFEIAEYLKHYTKKIKQFLSVKPDIVFEINGEEWAVEVETGIIMKKNKRQLLDKVESLKDRYGRRWFFVITDRNLLKSYKRYGKTFTRRNILGKIDRIMRWNGIDYTDSNPPSGCENNF